jgi:23S rRNA (uracil1939-C5)-methyltransferase
MPEKNQLYEAVIEDITSEGSGVCHIDGMAVFVPDTAVGDRLTVKLVKVLNDDFGVSINLIDVLRNDYSLIDLAKLVEKKNER